MAAARSSSSYARPFRGSTSSAGSRSRRRPNRGNDKPAARRAATSSAASELEAALDAAQRDTAAASARFDELGLPKPLVTALAGHGIDAPFAIQARAIPDALAGRDVLGRAQTGGGKTLAFGLPLLARIASSPAKRVSKSPHALVLVPTRELAIQVADALRPLGEALGLKTVCVFGGAPYGKQVAALDRGVDLVVATPGRLIDLIDKGSCTLRAVEITVLDEADHMADLGFLPAVTQLLDLSPAKSQRLLFSATLDRGVASLVRAYLHDPALHAVTPAAAPIEAMEHLAFVVSADDKLAVMTEVASRPARTLIFVRTKHGADRLAKQLGRAGVEAAAIHGNLKQNARQRALAGFAAGSPRVLVATDVAARGIHVDDIDLVVHFDPPNDAKDYLHRSGRTARAGATGTALALVLPEQLREVAALHRSAGVAPVAVEVHRGHAAVRKLATSGAPIRAVALPAPRTAGATAVRPRRAPTRAPAADQSRTANPSRKASPFRPTQPGQSRTGQASARPTARRPRSRKAGPRPAVARSARTADRSAG
jgi:superfamily II DNA/RNA helicase